MRQFEIARRDTSSWNRSPFYQLGVREKIDRLNPVRFAGNNIHLGDQTVFEAFGKSNKEVWRGFHLKRRELDHILVESAIEKGAKFLRSCKANRPLFNEDKKIIGIQTNRGKLPYDWIIDATGSSHWLARSLRIPIKKYSETLIAWYSYFKSNDDELFATPLFRKI